MKKKGNEENKSKGVGAFVKELLGELAWVGVVLIVCLLAIFVSSLALPTFREAMPFEFWIFTAVVLLYVILWIVGGLVRLIEKRKNKKDKEDI